MDNMDYAENNAKVSDSAYSNSCSNSQSRRSCSSKSTHSGSNSSRSSGYGGKQSNSGSSSEKKPQEKRSKIKDGKQSTDENDIVEDKDEQEPIEADLESPEEKPQENYEVDNHLPSTDLLEPECMVQDMDVVATAPDKISEKGTVKTIEISLLDDTTIKQLIPHGLTKIHDGIVVSKDDGFWCVISMADGIVMYATASLTKSLGFPTDMWIGKSFIEFVHPNDRDLLTTQITGGTVIRQGKKVEEGPSTHDLSKTTGSFCRIRKYHTIKAGYTMKVRPIVFMPFVLKLLFKKIKNIPEETLYLVIHAMPLQSCYKGPNEHVKEAIPFIIRHTAAGTIEYIGAESIPYLGYLPQELVNENALQLYHPEDLSYLKNIYEMIVTEGSVPRCRPFRMRTQNGDYVVLQAEWSSFVNPWSKKIEFVLGLHFVVRGPRNPAVFQQPSDILVKSSKINAEEKRIHQITRERIVQIMTEMLPKPSELAKQSVTKRCHDLAFYMDDYACKDDENDMRRAHNFYERDSVLLGGISPHREFEDDESSSEPLSYNQLNFNENIQRYFESYGSCDENKHPEDASKSLCPDSKICLQSAAEYFDFNDAESTGQGPIADLEFTEKAPKLTECIMIKHNVEMEKEMVRKHRPHRTTNRSEKKENLQKEKEHLTRCNAEFLPTPLMELPRETEKDAASNVPHGVKRSFCEPTIGSVKHHCSYTRQLRRTPFTPTNTPRVQDNCVSFPPAVPFSLNASVHDGSLPQQIPVTGTTAPLPGLIPVYFGTSTSTSGPTMNCSNCMNNSNAMNNSSFMNGTNFMNATNFLNPPTFPAPSVQYVMYPQPMPIPMNSPFVYSPVSQFSLPVPSTLVQQSTIHFQACQSSVSAPKKRKEAGGGNSESVEPQEAVKVVAEPSTAQISGPVPEVANAAVETPKPKVAGEENIEKTDDSSYSTFNSSFFKTDSGSAEETSDHKSNKKNEWSNGGGKAVNTDYKNLYQPYEFKKIGKRKIDPPWMEKVNMTSELIYNYQVTNKTMEDVLKEDKEKILKFEQPSLVNDQLGQLYADLQLEGVAARLSLEEGMTSSDSSGEETSSAGKMTRKTSFKMSRRKRQYSKLALIYEEDAPLPSPPECAVESS